MKNGWPVKSVGELCVLRPPKAEARKRLAVDAEVSFLPMEDLGIDVKHPNPTKARRLAEVEGSYTYFADGDVLLAKITPCFQNGKLGIATGLRNGIGFGSSEFFVLRPNPQLDAEYLYYFLSRVDFREEGVLRMGGAVGQQRVPPEFVTNQRITVPPILEQRRIVGILDEAFDGIAIAKANAERNLQNARALFESHLHAVFTRRGKAWVEKRLDEVCYVDRGSSPRPIKNFFTTKPDGVNWIKIGDAQEGEKYITSTAQKITPEGAKESVFVKEGDFLLTNSMSFGRSYIMKTQGYIHDGWFCLRLNESINSDYFYYLLSSSYVRDQFNRLAAGAIVLNISSDLVKKAVLPIPPYAKQLEMVKAMDKVCSETQRLESLYQRKLAALDELKKSLLHQAFSGEL